MKNLVQLLFSCCVLLEGLTFTMKILASSNQVIVSGWNVSKFPESPQELFHDPVLGRISCPALMQFNGRHQRSTGIILHTITDKGSVWNFTVRPGIYFWSGKEVTGQDLASFLKANLLSIVRWKTGHKNLGLEFEVQAQGLEVAVIFASKPSFGPYILNGWPFFRATSSDKFSTKFECSGRFWPTSKGSATKGLELKRTPNYKGRTDRIIFYQSGKSSHIQILWPKDFSGEPKYYSSPKHRKCMPIQLPAYSGLFWASQSSASQTRRQLVADRFELRSWVQLSGLGLNTFLQDVQQMQGPKNLSQQPLLTFLGPLAGKAGIEALLDAQEVRYTLTTDSKHPGLDLVWQTFKSDGLGVDGASQLRGYTADFSQLGPPTRTGRATRAMRAWDTPSPVGGLMRHGICIRTEGLGRKPLAENDADWFRYLIP